jgi:hypothetical protein
MSIEATETNLARIKQAASIRRTFRQYNLFVLNAYVHIME